MFKNLLKTDSLVADLTNKLLKGLGLSVKVENDVIYVDNSNLRKIVLTSDIEVQSRGNVGINSDKHIVFQSGWNNQGYIHNNPYDFSNGYKQKVNFEGFSLWFEDNKAVPPAVNNIVCEEIENKG